MGDLRGIVELEEGDVVRLYSPEELFVSESEVPEVEIPIPDTVLKALQVGDEVLLDDGKILVKVVQEDYVGVEDMQADDKAEQKECHTLIKTSVDAQVLRGGILRAHKSIKIVGKDVEMPVLTAHDIANLKLAKEYGVTALMQPFVRSGEDLRKVRQMLSENNAEAIQIFAKIENRTGVANCDDILERILTSPDSPEILRRSASRALARLR